jgi:hypothetical protein
VACVHDVDCQSTLCDMSVMKCTDICYADTDCIAGWRCRPTPGRVLHGDSGGPGSWLCCGL